MASTAGRDGSDADNRASMSMVTRPVSPKAVVWKRRGKRCRAKRRRSMAVIFSICWFRYLRCGLVRVICGRPGAASESDESESESEPEPLAEDAEA